MLSSSELRAAARVQLKGGWLPAVGAVLIYTILTSLSGMVFGIGYLIAGGPLAFGMMGYFSHKARGEEAEFENVFEGFKPDNFARSLLLLVLMLLFTFLWSLLLFIPGIIKAYSYSMSFFILRDNPGMSAGEALDASKKMMLGNKWRLFCLHFSFIGWCLLAVLTLGVGILWLAPYVGVSTANFYESLKKGETPQITQG